MNSVWQNSSFVVVSGKAEFFLLICHYLILYDAKASVFGHIFFAVQSFLEAFPGYVIVFFGHPFCTEFGVVCVNEIIIITLSTGKSFWDLVIQV